ncbi:Na+/H+ antiporter [Skermania sp. ID1734]|uniref:Na+/H+ antiporter n=1 Tax=Skermania sp. ID1734 TaxID=2597516 RepID=UPI0011812BB7|nr:Na+/H+ antiporter [Skermania sp. ID1734]TSD98039.1 Na+/H+ antiporter [Skermania sp. ID1734]
MHQFALLFILLLGAVLTVPLGDKLGLPAPVLMTLAGIVLALLPFVPDIDISPEYILPLLLPPLLYAAVQRTSWRQFAANWQPIFLLAVALVFVTTAAVAVVANSIVPGLPIAAAVALGALVAPPDPVAVSAVAGSLGLPRRLVSILEGEGLFNDVTSVVLYNVAIAAVVSGSFTWSVAAAELALSAIVAVAVGVLVGFAGARLMTLLGDATLRVGLTLLLPYASYVISDQLHGSGVLAVLVTALFLNEKRSDADDIEGRLTGRSFWTVIDTLVTGVAFGVIGLELHTVLGTASGELGQMLVWGIIVSAVVIAVRFAWLVPAAAAVRRTKQALDPDAELPSNFRETIVMWWSGMRGVVTVALALAVPLQIDKGSAFPGRNQIIFIAFTVIIATLVVQGLTLPWLVRTLRVTADTARERALESQLAQSAMSAARTRLHELAESEELPDDLVELLTRRIIEMGVRIDPDIGDDERRESHRERLARVRAFRRAQSEIMSAARQAVLAARHQPGSDPELVDRVLHQLDVRSLR